MKNTWWKSGLYNAICDVCGFKYKSSDLRQRWDGLMVCHKDWETRHPQDLIRPLPEQKKLAWTRPEATDTYISVTYDPRVYGSEWGRYCQADIAEADVAIVGMIDGGRVP